MVGSYLFSDELEVRSREHQCRSGPWPWRRLGESGRSNENGNGESHEAPLLAPPLPPPPPMTHAEMMAEMLAARRESSRALEMLA